MVVTEACNVDAAVGCHTHSAGAGELPVACAIRAPFGNEHAVRSELLDTEIASLFTIDNFNPTAGKAPLILEYLASTISVFIEKDRDSRSNLSRHIQKPMHPMSYRATPVPLERLSPQ